MRSCELAGVFGGPSIMLATAVNSTGALSCPSPIYFCPFCGQMQVSGACFSFLHLNLGSLHKLAPHCPSVQYFVIQSSSFGQCDPPLTALAELISCNPLPIAQFPAKNFCLLFPRQPHAFLPFTLLPLPNMPPKSFTVEFSLISTVTLSTSISYSFPWSPVPLCNVSFMGLCILHFDPQCLECGKWVFNFNLQVAPRTGLEVQTSSASVC